MWLNRFRGNLITLAYVSLLACGNVRSSAQNVTTYDSIAEPYLFLVREPAVHAELKLSSAQMGKLVAINERFDETLLASRTWEAEKATAKTEEVLAATRQQLATILNADQQRRLKQIAYRTKGFRCIALPDLASELQMTPDQSDKISQRLGQTDAETAKLRAQVDSGELDRAAAEKSAQEARSLEQADLLAILSDSQKQSLVTAVGDTFDLHQLRKVTFRAPEIACEGTWLNTGPLKLSDLQGKVVAVHFWAFGCINCIHNYPWYRDWHTRFATKGLTLVGIHTPETSAEQSLETLRHKVEEEKFEFPILADQEKVVWNRWGNGIWPSVYLIDKKGRLRYWWYGELNWQGAGGQEIMAKRIEELLSE